MSEVTGHGDPGRRGGAAEGQWRAWRAAGGVPGVLPAKVLVLGGGVVGTNAARMAMGWAPTTLIDKSLRRLAALDELFGPRLKTQAATQEATRAQVLAPT